MNITYHQRRCWAIRDERTGRFLTEYLYNRFGQFVEAKLFDEKEIAERVLKLDENENLKVVPVIETREILEPIKQKS